MARPQRYLEPQPPPAQDDAARRHRRRWPWRARLGPRALRWIVGVGVVLVLLIVAAEFLLDAPLRGYMERKMNQRLKGYTVNLGRLDFHPIGFSMDFENLVMIQDAHPDPPVARFPRISASVQWRALLRGRLVADFVFYGPVIHADLGHLRAEAKDRTPVTEHGWQDALEAMYPLKINLLRVWDGEITYIDAQNSPPLRLSDITVRAGNIRNIDSPDRVYPSTLWLQAVVFDSGRLIIDGNADFLAEPFPGVLAKLTLENVKLDSFKPVLARQKFSLRKGTLNATGDVEYAPTIKAVHLEEATIDGLEGDLIHDQESAATGKEQQAAQTAAAKTEEATNQPGLDVRADRLRLTNADVGFVNRAAKAPYRAFLSSVDLRLENFSNHFTNGAGHAKLTGKFMGSGATTATATFRPELSGPDFEINVAIRDTKLTDMNDMLRAYGNFDVVAGIFSFFSELRVKNGRVDGYIKPLFTDVKAYDRRQDQEKSAFRKLYERLIGGVSKLLENVPRREVVTKAEVSGPVESPKASTWQVIVRLVQNAFFKAILPGFDRELGKPSRRGAAR